MLKLGNLTSQIIILNLFAFSILAQDFQTESFFQILGEETIADVTAIDDDNNLYVAGEVTGEVDFDLGSGTVESFMYSFGDIFVAKYDSQNELQTAFFLDGNSTFDVRAMDTDQDGNIYITGFFNGTANFDLASDVELTAFGTGQTYIAKYTPEGSLIWVNQIGETNFSQFPFDMIVQNNTITLAMVFTGNVDFDPGAGITMVSGNNTEAIVDFDLDGEFENVDILTGSFLISDMEIDNDQNLYLSGGFSSTANVALNGTQNITAGGFGFDGFVAKYDSSRDLVWVKDFGTSSGSERGHAMAVDSENNLHCIIKVDDDLQIDDTSIEGENFTHVVFDEGGNVLDASYKLNDNVFISHLRILSDDRVVLEGSFSDETNFNAGGSLERIISPVADMDNRFLVLLDNNYELEAASTIYSSDIEDSAILIDSNDEIIAATSFEGESKALFGSEESVTAEGDVNLVIERLSFEIVIVDVDGDGFTSDQDCDDNNSEINPGQDEIPYNGIDDDCNAATLDDDLDEDGFASANDCDDTNSSINPDQVEEAYNGIDDDCNPASLDDDLDEDGFALADDCDDANPEINPNGIEIAGNGIDEDCDGLDQPLSTYELENASLNIYPNPTTNFINIDVTGSLNYSVNLYSIDNKNLIAEMNAATLDVKSFSAGTYILVIKDLDKGQVITERIVIY